MVNYNIEKLVFYDTKLFPINDFGIYNFFRYSDNINKAKLVATVVDGKYVSAVDFKDKAAHWQLVKEITDNFDEIDFCIGSLGDEIFVNKNNKLTAIDFRVLLGVLEEIRKYCNETGNVKYLNFYCDELKDDLKELDTSDRINEVIDIVSKKCASLDINNN